MKQLTITNVRVPSSSLTPYHAVGPFQTQNLHIAGNLIKAVNREPASATSDVLTGIGCYALPGFIDLHVHGGVGADTMDASPQALEAMARFFARHGVTSFCPTTMTAPHQQILAAVKNVGSTAQSTVSALGGRLLGVHVEGPYISPHYPGAQPAEYIRAPKVDELRELIHAGPISMLTLAPEVSGAEELIRLARQKGIVVVIGHTNATYEECLYAIELGATQATHTYNAMNGLHHRAPGTLGAILSNDALDAQLIADNIHVHPAAMKILSLCKNQGRTILITDAMRAAGLTEGEYRLGGQVVTVQDGACRLKDGTLAGSILTMDEALRNFMEATGLNLAEAWPTTSHNAARSLGIDDKIGLFGEGYMADIVLLNENYRVVATIVDGEIVYLPDAQRLAQHAQYVVSKN